MPELVHLARWSAHNRRTHPALKRLVFAATRQALRRVFPADYHGKCHVAAACSQALLSGLHIPSTAEYGAASWRVRVRRADGSELLARSGYWSPAPGLPAPHVWLRTGYGELVDLACSFNPDGIRAGGAGLTCAERVPALWADDAALRRLSRVRYERRRVSGRVTLDDASGRWAVRAARAAFGALAFRRGGGRATPARDDLVLVETEESVERLLRTDAWVRHNVGPAGRVRATG